MALIAERQSPPGPFKNLKMRALHKIFILFYVQMSTYAKVELSGTHKDPWVLGAMCSSLNLYQ